MSIHDFKNDLKFTIITFCVSFSNLLLHFVLLSANLEVEPEDKTDFSNQDESSCYLITSMEF